MAFFITVLVKLLAFLASFAIIPAMKSFIACLVVVSCGMGWGCGHASSPTGPNPGSTEAIGISQTKEEYGNLGKLDKYLVDENAPDALGKFDVSGGTIIQFPIEDSKKMEGVRLAVMGEEMKVTSKDYHFTVAEYATSNAKPTEVYNPGETKIIKKEGVYVVAIFQFQKSELKMGGRTIVCLAYTSSITAELNRQLKNKAK